MKKAVEIFRRSLALMGATDYEENEVLRENAVSLINVLLSQLYGLDLDLRGEKRVEGDSLPQIYTLEDRLNLSEPILFSVMPLGLAGYLLNEEDPQRSMFFLQLYRTEYDILQNRAKQSRRHKIERRF
jgi:hypothetical protein